MFFVFRRFFMLEMVPELLIDKQHSEIINIVTMEQKEHQEYSLTTSAIQESETTDSQASNDNPDTSVNPSDNLLVNILSTSLKNKVVNLLQKTNLTEKELLKRVQLIKRKTKDKRKPSQVHRIFSQKNSAGCYFNSTKRLKRQKQLKYSKHNKKTDEESSTSCSVTSELEQDFNSESVITVLDKDSTEAEVQIEDNSDEDYHIKEIALVNKSQESKDALFSILEKITEINTDVKKDFEVKENRVIEEANTNNDTDVSFEEIKRNNNDIKLNAIPIIDLTEGEEKNYSKTVDLTDDIDDILDGLREDLFQLSDGSESSPIAKPRTPSESIDTDKVDQQTEKLEVELKKSCTAIELKQTETSMVEETEIILLDDSVSNNETDNQSEGEDVPKNQQELKENEEVIYNDNKLTQVATEGKKYIQTRYEIEKVKDSSSDENSYKIAEIINKKVENEKAEEMTIKDASNSMDNEENYKFQEPAIELNNKIAHVADTKDEDAKKDDSISNLAEIEEKVNKMRIPSEENNASRKSAIELNYNIVHIGDTQEEETNVSQSEIEGKKNKNCVLPEENDNSQERTIELNNKIIHTKDMKEVKKSAFFNPVEIEENINKNFIPSEANNKYQLHTIDLKNTGGIKDTIRSKVDIEENIIKNPIPFEENESQEQGKLNATTIHSQAEIKEKINKNSITFEENDSTQESAIELNTKIVYTEVTKVEKVKDENIFSQAAIEEKININSIPSGEKAIELNKKVYTEDTKVGKAHSLTLIEEEKLAEKSINSEDLIEEDKKTDNHTFVIDEFQSFIPSQDVLEEREEKDLKTFEISQDIQMMKIDHNVFTVKVTTEVSKNTEELVANEGVQEVFEVEEIAHQNSKEVVKIRKTLEKEIDKNSLQSEECQNLENEEVDKNEIKIDKEHQLGEDVEILIKIKETEVIETKTDMVQKGNINSPDVIDTLPESSKRMHEELQNLLNTNTDSQDVQNCANGQAENYIDVETKRDDFISLPSTSTAHVGEEEEETDEESNLNIYLTLYGDDDIRNKIKEQLQLLRQVNRKPSFIHKEEFSSSNQSTVCLMEDLDKSSTSKYISTCANIDDQPRLSKENLMPIEDDVLPCISTSDKELQEESAAIVPVPVKKDLKEVLLSNEGELMIVNVVGGYFSDHDDNVESVAEVTKKPAMITCQKSKKISITEKLLIELSQDNFHCIKPTKTTDITKIKGWRSKQFNVRDEETEVAAVEESEEVSQLAVASTETMINSIENPIPGTSSNYLPPPAVVEIISEPTDDNSIKSDNILKQGEKENEEKNKKSAFVSDELETFLNNNRQLNISYEIPKLVAEEAISKPKSEMPLSNNNYLEVVEKSTYKPKVSKKGKPKTLAEKRRMLEQDHKMQMMHDMSVREDVYLKELAYCQKRNLTEMAEDIRDVLVTEEIPISRTCWLMAINNSKSCKQFISVNGKRIRIAGSAGGDNLTEPKIFPKHRLCNIDERKMCDTSKYKPGPLSKKHKLLKSVVQRNWESHLLKMPHIKLEVYPEYKKPLPLIAQQYLQLCRADKFVITKDWAQFAVTAVQTRKQTPRKMFEYELPYARNQNKLLVRKPAPKRVINPANIANIVKIPNKFAHINVEDSVKQIVDDLITCVENQELDKQILKQDPDLRDTLTEDVNKLNKSSSPVHDALFHHTIIKRLNVKRNRSTLELRRLNVQVIEVDVKDDEAIPDNCDKQYCKLGCICNSLRGSRSGVPEHCGRESCMFKCNCSFDTLPKGHHSITLPAGTDILSASTMVRLQDEAKKNLAKVEREFTQTVIKANNQTIMVGGGTRDRTRRIPKVPKKYSNFTVGVVRGSNEEFDDSCPEKVSEKIINRNCTSESDTTRSSETKKLIPIWNKTRGSTIMKNYAKRPSKCFVLLEKLNLKHAIPWCMVHNLYKCYCNGKAVPEVKKTEPVQKPVEEPSKKSEDSEYITYNPRFSSRPAEPSIEHADRFCARTKAVPSNLYQTRNKSQAFKEKYAKMAKQLKKQKLRSPETSDDEWLPIAPPKRLREDSNSNDAIPVEQNLLVPTKNKSRKNRTIIVAAPYSVPLQQEDPLALPEVEQSAQPQEHLFPNEELFIPSEGQAVNVQLAREGSHIISSTTLIDYDKSYSGFITPSADFVKHFYKMLDLNEHTEIYQIRLLEWQTMATRHKLGLLQVWFNTKRYNNIILTENRKRPSPSHMNIKHFNKVTSSKFQLPDIISSLLKNTLPGKALEPTETYTIILFDGVHWEARGTIVLSESENICRKKLLSKPTPPFLSLHAQPTDSSLKKGNFSLVSSPSMSIELINSEGETVPIKPECNESEINHNLVKKCIHVPLPTGSKYNKWFSLILTNNFYSLRITFSNYCIKYTALEEIVMKASKQQRTVIIKTPAEDYDGVDKNYGIYAVPGFRDRIFFGPYSEHQIHGLETFRYINGKLVNTKYYHKITGNYNKILGSWFKHTSTAPSYSDISQYVELPPNPELCPAIITTNDTPPIQSDFVDLTVNADESDSDSNNVQEKIDPLLSVLTADFSKKASSPVTITPVEEPRTRKPAPLSQKTNIKSVLKKKNGRPFKRKSVDPLATSESTKQIKLIDSINLEDDDQEMPVLQPFNNEQSTQSSRTNNKQMPVLTALDPKDDAMSKKRLYVITNIPGVGYFELSFRKRNEKRKVLCITVLGVSSLYPTINSAIQSLHQ